MAFKISSRRPNRTAVVMHADAVQSHPLAVQQKSPIHVELGPPNPKNRVVDRPLIHTSLS
jgi:hypothetical protein